MKLAIEDVKFDERGLVPAIVQDARTRQVLTLAYMNAESLAKTLATHESWFWSRSRSSLWHKGETSGNTQRVVDVLLDCDGDALTLLVVPNGPACHTGARSCFASGESAVELPGDLPPDIATPAKVSDVLDHLYALVQTRKIERPAGSYTSYLFNEGLDKILKKVGEESAETIIAAKNDDPGALVNEISDLLYHLVVLLVERGLSLAEVRDELLRRGKKLEAS
jgi:phosphoribosyl-ATP pyrophosphohydrolase/phosphoribosyl-AMP cyclohydrolase